MDRLFFPSVSCLVSDWAVVRMFKEDLGELGVDVHNVGKHQCVRSEATTARQMKGGFHRNVERQKGRNLAG